MASLAKSKPSSMPIIPNIVNQAIHIIEGITITPKTNSLIVLPLEILAINTPTNGVQDME